MAGCLLGVMMIFGLSESLHFKKDMLGDAQYYFLCFPVISALFFSGSSLSIKKIASYDDAVTTVLYLMGLMALGSGIFCIPHWVWPNGKEMLLLIIIGVVYGLCQWLYIKAFSMFHSGFLSVFKFFRFPLNALVGWVFFMEKPPLNVLLGGGVILLMTLFLARVEQRQKQ